MQIVSAGLAGAQDDEQPAWFGDFTDGRALLAYGIPESDYAPLVFLCDENDADLTVYLEYEPVKAKVGDEIPVRIASGQTEVEFSATAEPQEMDDLLHLKGHAKLDDRLKAVLASTGDLTLHMETATITYPLKGAAEAAGHLLSVCAAKKTAAADLEIKLTNKAPAAVVGFLFSEAGVNDFDGDAFGNRVVEPGASVAVVIANGRSICIYDLRAEFDEDTELDPVEGTQNLCEKGEFVVHE